MTLTSTAPTQPRFDTALTANGANRLEQLLVQLEAESMALVPYSYGTHREVPVKKSRTRLIAGALCLWLATLVLAIAYFSHNRSSRVAESGSIAKPVVITSHYDPKNQQTADSVGHLAMALVTTSDRLKKLEAAIEKSSRGIQQIQTQINTDLAKPVPGRRAKVVATVAHPAGPAPVMSIAVPPITRPVTAPDAAGSLSNNLYRVLEMNAAKPHHAMNGSIDYWLVASANKVFVKVVPVTVRAEGVLVHDLEDGKNYILTLQGEWRSSAL